MDIPNSRFPSEAIGIIKEIAESHFIAFDLEFSGVAGRRPVKPGFSSKLNLQEYYEDVKAAAEKYQILQVGLTIVKEDIKKARYIARPYNFNVNPLPTLKERYFARQWSFNSGAISFLMRNGFKIDRPFTDGIPYLSKNEEIRARLAMEQEDQVRSNLPDMETKDDDQKLVKYIRKSLKAWQAESKEKQESYLNIPGVDADGVNIPKSLNRYQLRLTHQIVRNEYPKLQTKGMGHYIQVTNPTLEQQASELAAIKDMREREISTAVGFRWIIEAILAGDISKIPIEYLNAATSKMRNYDDNYKQNLLRDLQQKLRDRRRVLVGHNCFTDLINLYHCFIGDLPDSVEEFQDLIHQNFPAVLDTKVIASFGNKRWGNTSLEDVEADLRSESNPKIDLPTQFDRYLYSDVNHEAGYDSLLTAKIAIKLPSKMEREGQYLKQDQQTVDKLEGDSQGFGIDDDGYITAPESQDQQDDKKNTKDSISQKIKHQVDAVKQLFNNEATANVPKDTIEDPPRPKKKTKVSRKSNIYEFLEQDQEGPDETTPDEDVESLDTAPVKRKKVDAMVKAGQILPRWESVFWKRFGNKLQVNGSKEGICNLV